MLDDVPQPFPEVVAHPSARRGSLALRRRFVLADSEQEERRADEAHRVEEDGGRRGQPIDEQPRDSRTAHLRTGAADLELRVSVHELPTLDERRQVRLVGDVEEDGRDPDEEADAVQLGERQRVEGVGDRDGNEEQSACEVAEHEDRPAAQPVDPDAGGKADEQEGQELDDAQRGHLECRCVQHVDCHERQGQQADLRAELADRLGGPELEEVRVPPEAAGRPEPHERSLTCGAGHGAGARSIRTSPETVLT